MSPHRPTLAGILLAVVAALTTIPALATDPQEPRYGKITAAALAYLDTRQGECWPWMQRVVLEATGKQIGFDYREGFFEAGAIEVEYADARDGDIIQIADDANTSPGAGYAGLHTSIVIENLGGGRFNVIDSNSRWDGVVRLRPAYDPFAAAARYGLDVHVYRVTGDAGAPPNAAPRAAAPATPPAATDSLAVGDLVQVSADGDGLNLRTEPGTTKPILVLIPDGTALKVIEGPVTAGARRWVKVPHAGQTGWVAVDYLAKVTPTAPATGAGRTAPVLPFRTFVPMIASH